MTVYLTRRESFCASHRLHSEKLSEEENRKLFGKCNSENGHGHNYFIEVTVRGEPNSDTGLVMNLTELKEIIHRAILDKVDHKHLNLDVKELKGINPTTENLARAFFSMLTPAVPKGMLFEVRVFETEKNSAAFRGEN